MEASAREDVPKSDTEASVEKDDGMVHLDSLAREKVTFDLDKYPLMDFVTRNLIIQEYRALNG